MYLINLKIKWLRIYFFFINDLSCEMKLVEFRFVLFSHTTNIHLYCFLFWKIITGYHNGHNGMRLAQEVPVSFVADRLPVGTPTLTDSVITSFFTSLPAGGGQRSHWRRINYNLTSIILPQGRWEYVAYHHQQLFVWMSRRLILMWSIIFCVIISRSRPEYKWIFVAGLLERMTDNVRQFKKKGTLSGQFKLKMYIAVQNILGRCKNAVTKESF